MSNPTDSFLLPGAIRLVLKQGAWLSEVRELVAQAEIVVVYASKASPGLVAELDLLRRDRLTAKSVLILSGRLAREDSSLASDFRVTLTAPPRCWLNQLARGPIAGRSRFRRQLIEGIETVATT